MNPTILLAIALALSLAGNAWLFKSRDVALAEGARSEQARKDTAAAATACSESVDGMAKAAARRHGEILARMGAQAGEVAELKGAAIGALNARPADPADLCKSVELYLREAIAREAAARSRGKP